MNDEKLQTLITTCFEQSMSIQETFFTTESKKIAQACWAMAQRYHRAGRLLAFGNDPWVANIQHVASVLMRPVVVNKRPLPAWALTNEDAPNGLLKHNNSCNIVTSFAHQLHILGRSQDIALGFSPDGNCRNVAKAMEQARHMGMLTLGLTGGTGGHMRQTQPDFCFVVPTQDPAIVQDTHETLYHILWELVHVFFERDSPM